MRFSNKVVLVTGADSGIGLAAAMRFASEGASVVLVDRDAAALPAASAMLRGLGPSSRVRRCWSMAGACAGYRLPGPGSMPMLTLL
jgi:NAD(P)-dependent dehydrogenase (short-subunit alcohol dehydrogenase family)